MRVSAWGSGAGGRLWGCGSRARGSSAFLLSLSTLLGLGSACSAGRWLVGFCQVREVALFSLPRGLGVAGGDTDPFLLVRAVQRGCRNCRIGLVLWPCSTDIPALQRQPAACKNSSISRTAPAREASSVHWEICSSSHVTATCC